MSNKIVYFALLAASTSAAWYAGYQYGRRATAKLYAERFNEEVDAHAYSERTEEPVEKKPEKPAEPEKKVPFDAKDSLTQYADILKGSHYTDYHAYGDDEVPVDPHENEPEGYTQCTLLYFSDDVITDQSYHEIENGEALIGKENLERLLDGEEESITVRNDVLHCIYEVQMDYRRYSDILLARPYLMDDFEDPYEDPEEEEDE